MRRAVGVKSTPWFHLKLPNTDGSRSKGWQRPDRREDIFAASARWTWKDSRARAASIATAIPACMSAAFRTRADVNETALVIHPFTMTRRHVGLFCLPDQRKARNPIAATMKSVLSGKMTAAHQPILSMSLNL